MSTFTAQELCDLAPADLADLLDMADGETVVDKAHQLGLDVFGSMADYEAVRAAVPGWVGPGGSMPPLVKAGQVGVKEDLTPEPAGPEDPIDGTPEGLSESLGLPEPSEAAAASMADLLAKSVATGEPFMAGTFALYAAPDGSVVLVTEDPTGDVKKSVVPPKMVRMALGLMAGKGTGLLGRMLRRG